MGKTFKLGWGTVCLAAFFGFRVFAAAPHFSKVMIVIFENADYDVVSKLPFFAKLAQEGANLTNFHAEMHPSQPNYLALISGDTQDVTSDDDADVDATNIGDLLEKRHLSWKVYAESYPGNCFTGTQSGTYRRKHNPFVSFESIQDDASRCSRMVNAKVLYDDIQNGTLPDYSFYVPDMNDDGHDTGPAYADEWYGKTFGPLIQDPRFMDGMVLVSTFDESLTSEPTNHIYTTLYGAGIRAGSSSSERYDHYDILRTIEDNFQLGTMTSHDGRARRVMGVWR